MRKTSILHLAFAAAMILVSGCHSEHSEVAAKMAATGPKGTHQSDREWYAQCKNTSPDTHDGVWRGSARPQKEWAIRDAAAHEKQYPGHRCTIEN